MTPKKLLRFSIIFASAFNCIWPLLVSFLLGSFQHACGFICIVIGARSTPAAVVGLLMLFETLLGPLWVYIFLNEIPPMSVFIGGSIIVIAVIFKTLEQRFSNPT